MRCAARVIAAVVAALLSWACLIASSAVAQPSYVEGEVVVSFRPPAASAVVPETAARHAVEVARELRFQARRGHRTFGLFRSSTRTTEELMIQLRQDPAIDVVEPNYLRFVADLRTPSDVLFDRLWGLSNIGQPVNGTSGTPGADIEFLRAWGMARPSSNVPVVVVIDTGVEHIHPDLISNMWTNPGEIPANFTDDDLNGYVDDIHGYDFSDEDGDPADVSTHGTHVAGTIAASGNNEMGIIGVAFPSKLMALKVSSNGNSIPIADVIEALQYATVRKQQGENIVAINMSFVSDSFSALERLAIQDAGDEGIIVCAAAGNKTNDNDINPMYPAGYSLGNIIAVAATDQDDVLGDFSNFGATTVDLTAPGVNILSTLPFHAVTTLASVQESTNFYLANGLDYAGNTPGTTATIYDCGLGYPIDFPAAVNGNIALIERGELFFSEKVGNAIVAGAVAAIIYNNTNGGFTGTLQAPGDWIPAVSLSRADGLALLTALPATGTVVNQVDSGALYLLRDGTSMATPHVAGAVAFASINFPDETVPQRVQRVLTNVTSVPQLAGLVSTGGRLNLAKMVDTDGNGLPDWWEFIHFNQLTGTDPMADPDNDRMTTLSEWLAGTDPTDGNSCLSFRTIRATSDGQVTLEWPSVEGKYYRLLGQTNAVNGFDQVLRTDIVASPPLNTEVRTNDAAGFQLYHLQLEP